jgi:hypothetical protein
MKESKIKTELRYNGDDYFQIRECITIYYNDVILKRNYSFIFCIKILKTYLKWLLGQIKI